MAYTKLVAVTLVGLGVYLQGCGNSGGGSTPISLGNTISGIATKNPDLSTLVTALKKANLVDTLAGTGPFTVFAPTNAAFGKVPNATLKYLLANKTALAQVLEYHVANGDVKSTELKNGEQIKTLEGLNVTVSIQNTTVKINDATVTQANVNATNGIVHLIDAVLIPSNLYTPTIPALATGVKDLSTLVTALAAADLVTTLTAAGPFTVFAPTNKAFAALPDGVLTSLLKPENKGKLVDVLKYHVASGEVLSTELKNGEQIVTLEGQKVNVTVDGSSVKINTASVTQADVLATNGAVHIIDAVLLPPGFLPMAPLPTHSRCQSLCPKCTEPTCKCDDSCWPGRSLNDTSDKTCECFAELGFCKEGEKPVYTLGKKCPSCWPKENKACDCFAAIGFCEPPAKLPTISACKTICPGCTEPTCKCPANACWPGKSLNATRDHTCECFAELGFCDEGKEPVYTPGKKCPSCWPKENKACMCFAAIGFCDKEAPAHNTVTLNNGVKMPILGFAAQVWDASTCQSATTSALQAGFRNVWSSMLIGADCQKAQWKAIKASSIPLSEIFVGGSVNSGSCSGLSDCYQQTKSGAESQLDILAKSPLDMIMLDYPSSASGCDGVLGQWKAFEELYAAKKVRTIAVSNFNIEQLRCIAADASRTVPSVNQMPYSVGHGSDTVVADNGALGIYVQAYSPLGSGGILSDPLITKIGAQHKKSAAQVALRWIVQRNVTIATQSTNPAHLQQDSSIFDFTLTDEEMAELNKDSSQTVVV